MTTGSSLICGLAAAGCIVIAQGVTWGATPPQSDQVRLVRLHVAAFDSNGKPVDGLTADDFKVQDQKKDRRIALFSREAAPAVVPGEYSNRVNPATRPATVILLDFLNPSLQAQLEAIKDLTKTLKQAKPGEPLFVYTLNVDGALEPVHPVEDWAKTDWIQNLDSLMAKAGQEAGQPKPAGSTKENTAKKTYVALETLSSKLATFAGPRQIVWLSYNVPYVWPSQAASDGGRPNTDYKPVMGGVGAKSGLKEDAKGAPWVAGSGDSVCPTNVWVDCALYFPHVDLTLRWNKVSIYLVNYAGPLDPGWVLGNEQFVGVFGGRSLLDPDLGTALARSATDGQGGYRLAYEQPPDGWDGKYHAIKLTCSRKDVSMLASNRYYAVVDKRDAATREQAVLATAFNTPSNVADIGLRASVTPGADQKSVRLQVKIDPADLLLARHGDTYSGNVTLSWVNYKDDGPTGAPGMARQPIQVKADQMRDAATNGIPLTQDIAVDSTIRFIRLFVVDRTTDSVGSLMIPITR